MYPHIVKSYYTDTDSVFLDYKLDTSLLGKEIGKFKLEYGGMIKKAIFPAPKLYLIDTCFGIIKKSKGYSGDLSYEDYNTLYQGDLIKVTDRRWFSSIEKQTVTLVDQKYEIKGEYNKRKKLYSLGR